MATGTVKWFNDTKGFGFITQDGGGEDVFCHHTAIKADGFRSLAEGEKVEFEVVKGPKGLERRLPPNPTRRPARACRPRRPASQGAGCRG